MSEISVNFNVNIDANEILKACGMGSQTYSDQDVGGGRFISCMANGQMVAAYFHPTKRHSATCMHGDKIIAKSVKDPGKWAIAKSPTAMLGGNKTKYNIL